MTRLLGLGQAKLFRLMTDRAITSGVALRRDPHSLTRVWLFPVDFVADCMAEFGDDMVAEHNAAICAQGVLPFKKPVAKKSRSNPYLTGGCDPMTTPLHHRPPRFVRRRSVGNGADPGELVVCCRDCHHTTTMPVAALLPRYAAETPFPEAWGGVGFAVRPG
jgi:hypothetical protein